MSVRRKAAWPKSALELPSRVRQVYDEIVSARDAGFILLPTAGVRMALEAVCEDQGLKTRDADGKTVVDWSGLIKKVAPTVPIVRGSSDFDLRRFAEYLAVGMSQATVHQLTNAVIHEQRVVSPQDLDESLKFLEKVLERLYGEKV